MFDITKIVRARASLILFLTVTKSKLHDYKTKMNITLDISSKQVFPVQQKGCDQPICSVADKSETAVPAIGHHCI